VYGDGHPCSGSSWEKMAWIGVGLSGVYLVICLVRLVFTFHETSTLVSILNGTPSVAGENQISSLTSTENLLNTLTLVGFVAYILGYVLFFQSVRTAVRAAGLNARTLQQHWTYYAWRGAVLVSLLLAVAGTSSTNTDSSDLPTLITQIKHTGQMNELYLGARVITVFILVAAIFSLRSRVRAALRAASEASPYGAYQQPQGTVQQPF
jgi:hypothetical protein